jgi:hypothetical protein
VCVLVLTVAARADEQTEALALVNKAIAAVGGAEQLARFNASTWNEKGTYHGMGQALPYTGQFAVEWPGRFRMEINNVFLIVLDGDQGWVKTGDQTREMTNEQLAEQKEQHYSGWIATLLPLREKEFKLSRSGEREVADKPALGINVAREGHRDVQLWFDQETGRLVKSQCTVKSEELGGKEVAQEVFYKDYRAVDGIQAPMKIEIQRDGKPFVEAESTGLKHHERLDASVFAKP